MSKFHNYSTTTQSETNSLILTRRTIYVKSYLSGSESPSDEGSDPGMAGKTIGLRGRFSEMPPGFLDVLKILKFLKMGSPDVCVTALVSLLNFDLTNSYLLNLVCEQEGLEMLVNLCEVDHMLCHLCALKVLRIITTDGLVAMRVVDLGIVPILLHDVTRYAFEIVENAVVILHHIGHLRRASKALRRLGGIPKLVSLLRIKKEILVAAEETLTEDEKFLLAITKGAAEALWRFSRFTKNKIMMFRTGITTLMTEILLSGNHPTSIPVSGILSECSNSVLYQVSIETEGLVGVLVENLTKNDTRLQWSSAFALMRAAGEIETVREMIRFHGGLPKILDLIRNGVQKDTKLIAAAIGALWKTAILEKNVEEYDSLGAVECIVRFVEHSDMKIKINAIGALAELAKVESARKKIIRSNVIPSIVSMLFSRTAPELLANVAHFVGQICLSPEGMAIVEEHDGLRLLWSLLRSRHRDVRLSGLWAVKNTVSRASDSGELIRSLSDAITLLITLLKDTDIEILTAVTGVIGEVALDRENLAVMSEQHVVWRLAALVRLQGNVALARELCSAIAHCGGNKDNLRHFRRYRVIPYLVPHLASRDGALKRQACRCFCTLSKDPLICVSMHACGAVPHLLKACESTDVVTQLAAAGCMANMRRAMLKADFRVSNDACIRRAVTR